MCSYRSDGQKALTYLPWEKITKILIFVFNWMQRNAFISAWMQSAQSHSRSKTATRKKTVCQKIPNLILLFVFHLFSWSTKQNKNLSLSLPIHRNVIVLLGSLNIMFRTYIINEACEHCCHQQQFRIDNSFFNDWRNNWNVHTHTKGKKKKTWSNFK